MSLSARSISAGVRDRAKPANTAAPTLAPTQDVEFGASFLEGFKDANVGRTKAAASAGHKAHGSARYEAVEAPEIIVIFERNVMMHRDVPLT